MAKARMPGAVPASSAPPGRSPVALPDGSGKHRLPFSSSPRRCSSIALRGFFSPFPVPTLLSIVTPAQPRLGDPCLSRDVFFFVPVEFARVCHYCLRTVTQCCIAHARTRMHTRTHAHKMGSHSRFPVWLKMLTQTREKCVCVCAASDNDFFWYA